MIGTGVIKPAFVIGCTHCGNVKAAWVENDGQKPPDLIWDEFPRSGRMVMSKETIIVACRACRDSLDAIIQEYGNTLTL